MSSTLDQPSSTLDQLRDRSYLDTALATDDRLLAGRLTRLAFGLRDQADEPATSGGRAAAAFAVPGRIELIGKHVDYAGGRSLTCAVDRGFCVVATPRPDRLLVLRDAKRGQEAVIALDVGSHSAATARDDWSRYPHALATRLVNDLPAVAARAGVTIAFESDLPPAAGISSSSALVVAIWLPLAWAARRAGASLPALLDRPETLAGYLGAAESGRPFPALDRVRDERPSEMATGLGVGTLGGAQDHTAILCARAGCLLQARYAPERIERWLQPAATGSPWIFAIQPSGVTARKAGGARHAYNRLANEAQAIASRWREASGQPCLTLGAAIDAGAAPEALRQACREDADLSRRLAQFLSEETGVIAAGDALASGDLAAFGATIARSQALAESHLGNQIPETTYLARTAVELGAHAASAFGAGFGGAVWAMVDSDRIHEFRTAWRARYVQRFPQHAPRGLAAERVAGIVAEPGTVAGPGFVTGPGRPARRLV